MRLNGSRGLVSVLIVTSCGPSSPATSPEVDGGASDATSDAGTGDATSDGGAGDAHAESGDSGVLPADGSLDAPPDAHDSAPEATVDGASGDVCTATDPPSLLACAASLQAGTASTLEIEGTITCTGAKACAVAINSPPKAITIHGQPGSVLSRVDHYDYPLLSVVNPPGVTFSDLVIDELASAACLPVTPTTPPTNDPACQPSIDVYGAGSVTVTRDVVLHSKAQAVVLNTCHNVQVTASRFVDAHLFGLQAGTVDQSLVVQGNLFEQIASNALVLFDVHGTSAAPALVQQNLFEHNHRENLYYLCGTNGNQPCDGGQLLINSSVEWLRVQGNVIRDGSSDTNPSTNNTAGIEINTSVQNVVISGNDIHNCNQSAVTSDTNATDIDGGTVDAGDVVNVTIVNNKFFGNGTFYTGANVLNFPPGAETGTCTTPACLTVALGALWPTPGIGIGWETNDFSPTLTAGGTTLSTQASGTASVAPGTMVTLLNGATQVDQILTR